MQKSVEIKRQSHTSLATKRRVFFFVETKILQSSYSTVESIRVSVTTYLDLRPERGGRNTVQQCTARYRRASVGAVVGYAGRQRF